MAARRALVSPVVSVPSRAMGGGKKKPSIPATETDFDVIFVGKYLLNYSLTLSFFRWY